MSDSASADPEAGGQGTLGRLAGWVRAPGGTRLGVWVIKHLVSPLDRRLYALTGGRLLTTGRPLGPILLLCTIGRRTGRIRTTPVFYLRDSERLVVCNVTPDSERANPWALNRRAHPPCACADRAQGGYLPSARSGRGGGGALLAAARGVLARL
jgi:F420H(2)-dependent quinone reductase